VRWLLLGLLGVLLWLQQSLWFGRGSLPDVWRLEAEVRGVAESNLKLAERNARLEAEVIDLKTGLDAIEERARYEYGLVGPGETFYQFLAPVPK